MKLGRSLLIGFSLALGLLTALPESADAQYWGRNYGHRHSSYYGFSYSPYSYGYYSPSATTRKRGFMNSGICVFLPDLDGEAGRRTNARDGGEDQDE
jgi:hypothetical protein